MINVENIKQNETVFSQGVLSNSINVITTGNVNAYIDIKETPATDSYKLFSIPKNMLFGIESSLHCAKYNFTFKADNDISFQKISIPEEETVKKFFNTNKNYTTYMIRSLSYTAVKLTDTIHNIDILYKDIATVLNNLSILFWSIKDDIDYTSKNETINRIKTVFLDAKKVGINIPNKYDANFIKKHDDSIFDDIYAVAVDEDLDQDIRLNFYKRLFKIPQERQEQFFSYDTEFSLMFADDIAEYILYSTKTVKNYLNACSTMINEIYSRDENSVFAEYINIAAKMKSNNWDNTEIISICNFILDYITNISNHYTNVYENNLNIDINNIKKVIEDNTCFIEKKDEVSAEGIEIVSGVENMPQELDKAAKKLVDAANLDTEKSKQLLDSLNKFRKVKDKFSTEDDIRLIRRSINTLFFEVYSAIAKKVVINGSKDKLYQMFLDYSFFDEELLSKKNIIDLYNIKDNTTIKNKELKVYTQAQLLEKVYTKELLPSINNLGQTYEETLRERMKRGEFNEDGFNSLLEDATKRLEYEVDNMISSTQKLCYGTISTYSAILHDGMILKDIPRSFSSKEGIEEAINSILSIDFSAFYREVLYKNPDIGLEKDIILEEVVPEFILSPTYGSKSIMWQELNGRNKRSRGRILVPALTNENVGSILINSIGAFRWELCKTVLGYSWNDVSIQSLTSEYYDYISFYRRNKDLGEEAREKLIAQIKKSRNNMRELFVNDYFSWLKYESESIIRLNKVARAIMYRNVPFVKELRDIIGKQPIFSEVAYKFEALRKKRGQELENKYARYRGDDNKLPDELQRYINFYKNM